MSDQKSRNPKSKRLRRKLRDGKIELRMKKGMSDNEANERASVIRASLVFSNPVFGCREHFYKNWKTNWFL